MGIEGILLQQATDQGFEIGLKKGIEMTNLKMDKKFTTSLITSTDLDNSKIAMLVGVTVEYVVALRQELSV